jgi:hypothetical protein
MKPPVTAFTEVYSQWLDSFRAMLPGSWAAASPGEPTRKELQAAAYQEWEDEGGSIKPPEKAPGLASVPKIPF